MSYILLSALMFALGYLYGRHKTKEYHERNVGEY